MNMKKEDIEEMNYDIPEEIDLTNAVRSPFPKMLKQQITINISKDVIDYFKDESKKTGIPYQTLINLYLSQCKEKKLKLNFEWK